MSTLKNICVMSLALALSACSGGCTNSGGQKASQLQLVQLGCASVSTANKVITQAIILKKITKAEDLAKIQKAKDYTYPICNPADGQIKPLSDLAMAEFNQQTAVLEAAKAENE